MSRSLSAWQAILLGFVIFAGLVMGGIGLFTVGSRENLFDNFTLTAEFKDAQRVEPGTPVFLHGMHAGEVTSVALANNGKIEMQLRMAGKFRRHITRGSKVQIASDSLFAGKVLKIIPNRDSNVLVHNDEVLQEEPGGDLVADLKNEIKKEVSALSGELKNALASADLAETVEKLNGVLAEADKALKDFNKGKGPIGGVTQELKQATNKLNGTVAKADGLLSDIQDGKGTLGKLLQSSDLYNELLQSLRDTRQMVSSVKQNSEAIQALPIIRDYVVDLNKILIRPAAKKYRMYFPEERLFQPGRAVLTDEGKRALDKAAQWLNEHKDEGSEVVIATFADPRQPQPFAQTLTQKQSEAVADYLKNNHSIHRTGWWWWENRTVQVIGCGNTPSPVPEAQPLPPARVELIVFVPEK